MNLTASFKRILISAALLLTAGSALACIDSTWYPAVAGATWTYSVGSENFTQTIVDVTADSMIMRMEMPGQEPMEFSYECTEGGMIQIGGMDDLLGDMDMEMDMNMEIVSMEGLTYPNELVAGTQWDSEMVMKMDMTMEGMVVDSTTTVTSSSTAVAVESVTVPAGTFDAMRINAQTEVAMAMTMMGMSMPLPGMSTTSDTWLAEGIGMVLTVDEDGSRTELLSYSIP